MSYDRERLDAIFGSGSSGATPEDRALTSTKMFVRSQMQLAPATPRAKGRVLNAREALYAFGPDAMERVAFDGSALIVAEAGEPSRTIAARRAFLGLSPQILTQRAAVSEAEVTTAETPGAITSVHSLSRIAEILSLDEQFLSPEPGARGDAKLGLRFRDLGGATKNDEQMVATLSEAAWVIRRQVELHRMLGVDTPLTAKFSGRSSDYRYKTSDRGYLLAARTRMLLGIDDNAPIESVRGLAERMIGVPVLEAELGRKVAGATISNGGARGIVLSNALDARSRSLFRRLTIAHELGHLLWDPDDHLLPVQVDGVDEIGNGADEGRLEEMRANAFAVALLAPAMAVRRMNAAAASPSHALLSIVRTFGISAQAARFHLANTCHIRLDAIELPTRTVAANEDWHVMENSRAGTSAIGFSGVPKLRAGRFAELVLTAARRGLISTDTGASWLRCDKSAFEQLQTKMAYSS